MKEVFISYSTANTAPAETVRNVLEKNGLSCWMAPRDIPGGSNYTKEIPIAIRNCKVFVLILSEDAQNSPWVLKELDSAVNCGKVILPFMLEECILNDEFNFLLTGAQRYSAYQKKAEAMETLIGRIRGILDVPASDNGASNAPAPEIEAAEEKPPVKKAPVKKAPTKPVTLGFEDVICDGCGSADVTPLPKRVKRHGAKELATMLLIPLFAILGYFLFFVIASFIPARDTFALLMISALLGLVVGSFLGNHISKTIVRRNRLRNRIQSTCYRCKRCSKVFRFDIPLED